MPDPVQTKTIICFGDSLVFGHGVDRRVRWQTLCDTESRAAGGPHYVNCGTSRESTDAMLLRFDRQVLEKSPSGLILMGGSNDLFQGNTPAHAFLNLKDMCIRALSAGIRVWLSTATPYLFPFDPSYWDREVDFPSVLPKREELNRLIRSYTENAPAVHLLDAAAAFEALSPDTLRSYYLDELHYNAAGHRFVADLVLSSLRSGLS